MSFKKSNCGDYNMLCNYDNRCPESCSSARPCYPSFCKSNCPTTPPFLGDRVPPKCPEKCVRPDTKSYVCQKGGCTVADPNNYTGFPYSNQQNCQTNCTKDVRCGI